MADADFGYVGGAPGKIDLYVGKVTILCLDAKNDKFRNGYFCHMRRGARAVDLWS
jgi:hypothetical protein